MPHDATHIKQGNNMAFESFLQTQPVADFERSAFQRTLRSSMQCSGIGVHSGEAVTMRLVPALENTGIKFIRTDLPGSPEILARWDNVRQTQLCTVIENEQGDKVATIEHLMAALHAYGIDNAIIEINGGEVPVMDGSSTSFVLLIELAGIVEQKAERREIEILRPIEISHDGKMARLEPSDQSLFTVEIDFDRAPINKQRYDFLLSHDGFKSEICRARTFGFQEEVEQLRQAGFARGGTLENAVIIKGDKVVNAEGLRYANEFVRHKVLDAIGDLALAGAVIRGRFTGYRTGHALNNEILRALFADTSAWRYVPAAAVQDMAEEHDTSALSQGVNAQRSAHRAA
jgi:UDP-3-O-[3-hydroxymyristoyl] N-acetylglucosamine deacetylase